MWDYFTHVRSSPRHTAAVRFTRRTIWDDRNPWNADRRAYAQTRRSPRPDILFLAGLDWRFVSPRSRRDSRLPVINLVQHVRHADPKDARYEYLDHRAIRVCYSRPIADALAETGRVNGPVFTVPAGLDLAHEPDPVPPGDRSDDLLVLASKQTERGRAIHAALDRPGRKTRLIDRKVPRDELLTAIRGARVSVLLPNVTEGFYFPALEGMALGTVVVCPDAVGNRGHCLDGVNCFRPPWAEDDIVAATNAALALPAEAAAKMLAAGRTTASEHTLERERAAFLEILYRVPDIWSED